MFRTFSEPLPNSNGNGRQRRSAESVRTGFVTDLRGRKAMRARAILACTALAVALIARRDDLGLGR